MFGVNILVTPTLLTFSQLQNFYLWTAIERNFTTYFWGHMDVVALSFEDRYQGFGRLGQEDDYKDFTSIYTLAVDALRKATSPSPDPNASDPKKHWAARFFAYDRLALVNREAYEKVGGFDTAIPYYHSDCDMHDRLKMWGFEYNGPEDVKAGYILDVAHNLDDLLVLYRKLDTVEPSFTIEPQAPKDKSSEDSTSPIPREWISDTPGSARFLNLKEVAQNMTDYKDSFGGGGRNIRQDRQRGGKGEPYYRDPEGFERGIQMTMELGRQVYVEKWGYRNCGLLEVGRKKGDEWRVEKDWD